MIKQNKNIKKRVPWNKDKKLTKKHRDNISKGRKGKEAWNKGVPRTEETRKKISKARIGQPAWNRGKKLTKGHKTNISKSLKGRKAWNRGLARKIVTRKKISKTRTGQPAWNRGKRLTEGHRTNIRKTMLAPEIKFTRLYDIFEEKIGSSSKVDQWLLSREPNMPIVNCKRGRETLPTHIRHCIHHKGHGKYTRGELAKAKSILEKLVKFVD